MNKKIFAICVVLCAGLIIVGLAGCGKNDPVDTPENTEAPKAPEAIVDTVESGKPDSSSTPKTAVDPEALEDMLKSMQKNNPESTEKLVEMLANDAKPASLQTKCPVMDGAINKDIFVEYKGQKVYFCCPPCKEKFNAAPESYLSKLPQFNK